MLLLNCPNCGERNASEFRYGGPYNPRPDAPDQADATEWTEYLFLQTNSMGEQVEWWYHRSGCELWFLAERNRQSNRVIQTYLWESGA